MVIEHLDYKSIMNLCASKKNIRNWCAKKEGPIFQYLLFRDFGLKKSHKEAKDIYIERITQFKNLDKKIKELIRIMDELYNYGIYYPYNIYDLLYNKSEHSIANLLFNMNIYSNLNTIPLIPNPFSEMAIDEIEGFDDMLGGYIEAENTVEITYENILKFLGDDFDSFIEEHIESYKIRGEEEITREEMIEKLKTFPEDYVEILRNIPFYNDPLAMRNMMVSKSEDNVSTFISYLEEENEMRNMMDSKSEDNVSVDEKLEDDIYDLELTEEEIDFIISIHERVMNGELKITTLFKEFF